MKTMKRLFSLALVLALAVSALTGCGGEDGSASSADPAGSVPSDSSSDQAETLDLSQITDPYLTVSGLAGDTVVARAGEQDITAAQLLYWVNYGAELYLVSSGATSVNDLPWDTDLGDGVTFADQMKQSALDAAAFYALLPTVAQGEGLSVTQETLDSLEEQRTQMLEQLGGDETALEHYFWYQMLTWDQMSDMSQRSDLHLQLQNLYYGEGSDEYPTDAEVLSFAQDELGIYRAKHILLMTVDPETREPLDEETIAQKKAQADDLLSQLRAAEDPVALFDELMNQYSEDTGLAAYPDGYTAQKGQMVPAFEEAALALQDGEISDVVYSETTGYHIILRLPLDPADYRDQLVAQRMQTRTDQWLEEYGVETLEAYDQLDPAAFREQVVLLQNVVVTEINAILEAQQADGSDSSADPSGSSSQGE